MIRECYHVHIISKYPIYLHPLHKSGVMKVIKSIASVLLPLDYFVMSLNLYYKK